MNWRDAFVVAIAASATILSGCKTAQTTLPTTWEAAYDPKTRTRFIPLELILGDYWNGNRELKLPPGPFFESSGPGAPTWTGPKAWRHRDTGENLMVYDRIRRSASQKMAVRRAGDAIGRVEDSRGDSTCDQEGKFPLGLWTQGETRLYEYTCWFGPAEARRPQVYIASLTIEEIDFNHGGIEHSLRVRWVLKRKDSGREVDHKIYVFSPGLSMVYVR